MVSIFGFKILPTRKSFTYTSRILFQVRFVQLPNLRCEVRSQLGIKLGVAPYLLKRKFENFQPCFFQLYKI